MPLMSQSLGIKSFIGGIVFVLAFLYYAPSASSSDAGIQNSSSIIDLQTIIISAVRSAVAGGRVAENMEVYSSTRISTMTVRRLGDILGYAPGVDVQVGNRLGQSTAVSIHGSNSRDVLVMVDDIPFNTQISGQANPTRIPIENIDRVEIVKGASSSAWGSGMGGVVNVITKDTGTTAMPTGSVTNSLGEMNTRKHSMDMAGKAGDVGYYVMDSYMTSDGVHRRSPVKEESSFGKLSYPLGDQAKLTGSLGYSGGKTEFWNEPDMLIEKTPYVSRYGKLRLDVDKPDSNFNMAYKYNGQSWSSSSYDDLTGDLWSATGNRNLYQGLSLNSQMAVRESDILVMGSDIDWHTIKSTNYLDTGKDIRMLAPYTNYTWKLDRWDIIPGLRLDENNRFGHQLSPSLGCVYHWNDEGDTQWRAKVSRAFNAPPLMWIYNEDSVYHVLPNPDLKAERALVYETGIKTHAGPVGAQVDFYRSDVEDGLKLTSIGTDYRYENVKRFQRQGAEAELDYKLSSGFKVYLSGQYNHVVDRTTHTVVRGNGSATQAFRGGVRYENLQGFSADLSGHYTRWDSRPDKANDHKFIFDSRLMKRWDNFYRKLDLNLFINIYNLTNSKYWSDPSQPIPARYFEGGATVNF